MAHYWSSSVLTPLKANALVDLEKHARLADFGLEYVVQQAAGTSIPTHLRWNAPELLRLENTTVETPATDVYSLGILFWEVCCHAFVSPRQ